MGKGDKTSTRTNWKSWFKDNILPERPVKLWPRDSKGNLIMEEAQPDTYELLTSRARWDICEIESETETTYRIRWHVPTFDPQTKETGFYYKYESVPKSEVIRIRRLY